MELRLLTNREDVVMVDIVTDKEINIDLLLRLRNLIFTDNKYLDRPIPFCEELNTRLFSN